MLSVQEETLYDGKHFPTGVKEPGTWITVTIVNRAGIGNLPFVKYFIMQTTNIAIAVLVVLDLGILVLVPHYDKWLYRNYPKEAAQYLNNGEKEGQLYRFIYTGFGKLLISAILGIVLVILYHDHDTPQCIRTAIFR